MDKISFINWLESHWPRTPVADPATDKTVLNQQGDTVNDPQAQRMNVTINTDVAQATNNLQNIQNQLTSIFKKVMDKPIWKNQQMKAAFGDKVTKGWERVGQARMIITPLSNTGNTEDDI